MPEKGILSGYAERCAAIEAKSGVIFFPSASGRRRVRPLQDLIPSVFDIFDAVLFASLSNDLADSGIVYM